MFGFVFLGVKGANREMVKGQVAPVKAVSANAMVCQCYNVLYSLNDR